MNIITYNARGLGRGVKWPAIRRLVNKQHVDMLCIQETKKELIDRDICQALWGDPEVQWADQPATHTAGGILCLWSEKAFRMERKIIGPRYVMMSGKWIQEDQSVNIASVYSPCDIQGKRVLWESIKQLKSQHHDGLWCILGDFNCIRNHIERSGTCHRGLENSGSREFNGWIEDLEVEEPPWVGSKFTWVRPNGSARSKLDRFLVSADWLTKWPGTTQFTLERNFSDHCPLLLRSKNSDWGPKPFRIMDCWLSDASFKKAVTESWTSNQISGWGGYVLKQKIKALKNSLRAWNRDHFGDTFKRFKKIEEELNKLEESTSDRHLSLQEVGMRKQLKEDLWVAAQSHESLLRQKARARWIKEGDCNSRNFHLMINARRRHNSS